MASVTFACRSREDSRRRIEGRPLGLLARQTKLMAWAVGHQSVAGGAMQPMAGASGGNAEIATLIAGLLSGDLASAAAAFTIDRRQDSATNKWHVLLQPNDAALARVIRSIEMTGCGRIEVVLIDQPNGDQDRVVFGEAG